LETAGLSETSVTDCRKISHYGCLRPQSSRMKYVYSKSR